MWNRVCNYIFSERVSSPVEPYSLNIARSTTREKACSIARSRFSTRLSPTPQYASRHAGEKLPFHLVTRLGAAGTDGNNSFLRPTQDYPRGLLSSHLHPLFRHSLVVTFSTLSLSLFPLGWKKLDEEKLIAPAFREIAALFIFVPR